MRTWCVNIERQCLFTGKRLRGVYATSVAAGVGEYADDEYGSEGELQIKPETNTNGTKCGMNTHEGYTTLRGHYVYIRRAKDISPFEMQNK